MPAVHQIEDRNEIVELEHKLARIHAEADMIELGDGGLALAVDFGEVFCLMSDIFALAQS